MYRYTKMTITSAVSNFLVLTGIVELWRILFKKLDKKKVTILVYHRVLDLDHDRFPYYEKNVSCSPATFEKQMAYLKKKFNIISLEQYVQARQSGSPLLSSSVVVTFDDGYREIYTDAYPILRKLEIPAIVYVTTDFIEARKLYWWDEIAMYIKKTAIKSVDLKEFGRFKLGTSNCKRNAIEKIGDKLMNMDEEGRKRVIDELIQKLKVKKHNEDISTFYLTWKQLREMDKNSIKIGAHTLSHPNLKRLDNNKLLQELIECKRRIEEELIRPVKLFAYPYGHKEHFDKRVTRAVKKAGFACACTTISGSTNQHDDLYQLRRIPVFHYNNMKVFKVKISGIFDSLYKLENWFIRNM